MPSPFSHPTFSLFLFSLSIKLLLFPTPHSTDLEVHRHWKALVHNLPPSRWYTDTSSLHTLDYPPLFALFELLLSHLAKFFHPQLLSLSPDTFASPSTKLFLRASVLLCDPLLALAAHIYTHTICPNEPSAVFSTALVLLSPALILIDNIHFQYNALPLSVLLLSFANFFTNSLPLAAFLFSLALNLKHTLLPLAPPVAVFILHSIFHHSHSSYQSFKALSQVAAVTISTFTVLWMPFWYIGGFPLLQAMLRRMFPFERGLLHAYWAPNFWALYAVVDKALANLGFTAREVDVDIASGRIGAMKPFAVLPNPTPKLCTALLVTVLLPVLGGMVKRRRGMSLVLGGVAASLAGFVFGWHVHEKAVLVPLLLLGGVAGRGGVVKEAFWWLQMGGCVGLFPLIRGNGVGVFRVVLFVAYMILMNGGGWEGGLWRWSRFLYAIGGVGVEFYTGVGGGHKRLFGERMEFLPLMVVSGYSAVGVMVSFGLVVWEIVFGEEGEEKEG